MSHARYLGDLDEVRLAALLRRRPDTLLEPAPRTLEELSDRLNGVASLVSAQLRLTRDQLLVAQVIGGLGEPTEAEVAARLHGADEQVAVVLGELLELGLAWQVDGRVGLPPRLAAELGADPAAFRPLFAVARHVRSDELNRAVRALGGDPGSMRKVDKVGFLEQRLADPAAVADRVAALPDEVHSFLLDLLDGGGPVTGFFSFGRSARVEAALDSGLALPGPGAGLEIPREVAVELRFVGLPVLQGRPDLPPASIPADDGRTAAEAALLAVTTLLDHAERAPLAGLKKGGVGARERTRLQKLGVPEPSLWIDLASAAGLLSPRGSGYGTSTGYPRWREKAAGRRWAELTRCWWRAEHTPTVRGTGPDEIAPPVPVVSRGGAVRRALLSAAAGGRSLAAAAAAIGWFCPLHGLGPDPFEPDDDADPLAEVLAATLREAELLGVVHGDRLTGLGEALVVAPDGIVDQAADLLPAPSGALVLQSDLSAITSGQPPAGAVRVLGAAATAETAGAATTWRFSAASVRAAMDAGWTADALRRELEAASGRALPQPLDYLLSDVARTHGSVLVTGGLTCLTGAEAELREILHTRSLRKLGLRALAPTVLACTAPRETVLAVLRKAGFAPMPAGADGVVELSAVDPDPAGGRPPGPATREAPQEVDLAMNGAGPERRADADELARRLLHGEAAEERPAAYGELERLGPHLDTAELALLSDGLEHRRQVLVTYRNAAGNRTVRGIVPLEVYGPWLRSFCLLRRAERDFTVSGIEAVSPSD
ncbi:helicase-associated domain-containing protein [Pseudonocardia sp. RS11V-5]|uniref:helicase-associated domain-containing protein n=1 Tax=Pseudonocardia terrae TaxID=2905831 RepID=UPI001E651B81|nr:helicase-associated domain-containing protein [Pseudonocardia terrae]MCE3554912.1 helicase-associated domain-containing protein [Pseudonocardia terrae]